MAKTVNYAGTVLGLNTEKYTKSLNTLKTQSASCANSIKNSFKGMAAGLAGAFSAVASFNKIVNSLKDYESKVSSLSAITGNIEDAKILFNDLNNLSRKIPQQFDDITAAAVNLNKQQKKTSRHCQRLPWELITRWRACRKWLQVPHSVK